MTNTPLDLGKIPGDLPEESTERFLVLEWMRLRERDGLFLACAESCTGGLISAAFTSVPGSSVFFRGGFVTYAEESKSDILGVPASLISERGVVSAEVAESMAEAAARRFGTEFGLSSTGYAGPSGGDADNPVGVVYIGFRSPQRLFARRFFFKGDRDAVRRQAVRSALRMILER